MIGVDIPLYQDILLKGIKGKGGDVNRLLRQQKKAIRNLVQEKEQTVFEMEQLVESYDSVFKSPRRINLRIASTKGNKAVYWRMPGTRGDQPYIRVFQSEKGQLILRNVSDEYVSMLADYELKRLAVNYRYSYLSKNISSIKTFVENLEHLPKYLVATV